MTSRNKSSGTALPLIPDRHGPLVTRSVVPAGQKFSKYKQYLRHDFFYSCGYCTMSEAEAQAVRFTIDHYEPRSARADLEHEYSNLMYSCDQCNTLKGDRCPKPSARADGYRFFRPDQDVYQEHFQKNGVRLESKTNVGYYSIQTLDLNRLALRRLREIRERLTKCDRLVAEGIFGLRHLHIDKLPQSIKGNAARAILQATNVADRIANDIDALLREHARSPLVDPDPEADSRAKDRARNLGDLQVLHPGAWRSPRKGRR
jgi:HNH endonuclease